MISVVIPVRDGGSALAVTMPAVLALGGVDEIVWVDDGSVDETAARLAAAQSDPRVRVVTHTRSQGRSRARNAGVEASRGALIVFLDADVEPPPEAARRLTDPLDDPHVAASVARLVPVPDAPNEPYQDYAVAGRRGPDRAHQSGDPLDWRFFLSGACAVRRDVLRQAGGFDPAMGYGEDQALACRLRQIRPDGLRLADVSVRLHDLGTLGRAVRSAAEFGRHLDALRRACGGEVPRAMVAAAPVARGASRLLWLLAECLPPGAPRRTAVRYLLRATALAAVRRA